MPVSESPLKNLVHLMAQALVDNPNEIIINEIEGERTTIIELKVAREDLGKVIGKQGRTAQAMRTILNGASVKLRRRTTLEILE